jgi:hypothetical protein
VEDPKENVFWDVMYQDLPKIINYSDETIKAGKAPAHCGTFIFDINIFTSALRGFLVFGGH